MTRPPRSASRRQGNAVAVAAVVSALWLAGAAGLLVVLGVDGAKWLAVAVAVALPVVAIWFAALLARQSAALGDEAERLERAEEALHLATAAAQPGAVPTIRTDAPPTPRTGPLPAATPPAPQARFAASVAPAEASPRQAALPLGMAPDREPVSLGDLTRALDFPDSPEDRDGFRALRRALGDPGARRLVQAAQDIVTLLSEDGIYMDDLRPAGARTALWRRVAAGERGPDLGPVLGLDLASTGGGSDRQALALTSVRLRADPVFHDAAQHFLRRFDRMLADAAPAATDAELTALTDTRSARAFMLVGRASGYFE